MIYEKGKRRVRHAMSRLLSGFLAVLMIISLLPVSALAAGEEAKYCLLTHVDGQSTEVSLGADAIRIPAEAEDTFYVTIPESYEGKNWAGWGDTNIVYARVIASENDYFASASITDAKQRDLTFTFVAGGSNSWLQEQDSELIIQGGTYRTEYAVTVDGESAGTFPYGELYQLPSYTGTLTDGQVFTGWKEESSGQLYAPDAVVSVKGAMDFTSVISTVEETAEYVVTFQDGNGSVLQSGLTAEGTAAAAPADPQREGYEFAGWDVAYDNITANTVVTAQWTAKSSAITTGTADHVTITAPSSAKTGETVTFTAVPDADCTLSYVAVEAGAGNYVNLRKTGNANEYQFTQPAKAVTVSAAAVVIPDSHTVQFVMPDGTLVDKQQAEDGADVQAPAAPVKEGNTFTGWNTAADGSGDFVEAEAVIANVTADMTYYAVFKAAVHQVEIAADAVDLITVDKTGDVAFGETVTITPNVLEGYEKAVPVVCGEDGTGIDVAATGNGSYTFVMPDQNVTVSAVNSANSCVVKFVCDGTLYDVANFAYGTQITAPADPKKDGADFVNWVTADGKILEDGVTAAEQDVTYIAQFSKHEWSVQTEVQGTDNASVETDKQAPLVKYAYGDTVVLTVTTPEGYMLASVTVSDQDKTAKIPLATLAEGSEYSFLMPDHDVVVTAVFEKIPADAHLVKFVSDGSLYDFAFVMEDDVILPPAQEPEKTGYTFEGWFAGGNKLNTDTTAYADVVYEAKFTANVYDIKTVVNPELGGVTVSSNNGSYGETKQISVAAPEGYVVKDIYVNGNESGEGISYITVQDGSEYTFKMPAEAVTVTVNYEEVPAGTALVKFVSNGAVYDYQMVTKGTQGKTPQQEPVLAGNTFKGWSLDAGQTLIGADSAYAVAKDAADEIVYTAVWEENQNQFSITAKGTNVTVDCAADTAKVGEQVSFTAEAEEGYALSYVKVYLAGSDVVVVDVVKTGKYEYTFVMPEGDVVISAEAERIIPVYTVNFRLDDSNLYDQQTVSEGEAVTIPEEPVKAGYEFKGWFTEKEGQGTPVGDAPKADKDVTYYAYFTPVELTVEYVDENGAAPDGAVLNYGDSYKVESPENADKFVCWSASDGRMLFPGETYVITESITLTAVYEETHPIYVVNFKGLDGAIYHTYLATVDNNYTVNAPEYPALEGFDFSRAVWDGAQVSYKAGAQIKNIESDLEFTLQAVPAEYNVDIQVTPEECGREVSNVTSADYGEMVMLTVGTPDGYVLKGITVTGKTTGAGIVCTGTNAEGVYTFVMPSEDVTVNVAYEEIPAGYVLVKFVNNGALFDYQIVEKGTTMTAPAMPEYAGHEFAGWKYGNITIPASGTYDIARDAADEIVFEAQWTAQQYQVSYVLDGGQPDVPAVTVEYGEVVGLPAAPEKAGYAFIGWQDALTNMIYNPGTKYTVTETTVFTAVWEELPANEYIVKFVDASTDILYGYDVVTENGTVTAPIAPVRTGYTFNHWADSTNDKNIVRESQETNPITKNTVFVADWAEATYHVTSVGSNCTVDPANQDAKYDEKVSFTVTADADYEVDSVYITYTEAGTTSMKVLTADADGVYSFAMPGADVEIVASTNQTVFSIFDEEDQNVNISGHGKKASVGDDVSFTVEAINDNYSVGNVYVEADDGTKVPVSIVMDGDTPVYHFTMPQSDVTICAQQVQNSHTVYYLDSDNTLLDIVTEGAGEMLTLKTQEAPEGYLFTGWKLLMSDKEVVYDAGEAVKVEADMYLQAVYEGKEFEVSAGVTDHLYILKADQGKDFHNSVDILNVRSNVLNAKAGSAVYFQVAAEYNWMISDITITSAGGNTDLAVAPTLIAKSTVEDAEKNECALYTYSFVMPAESVNINVYTEARKYNVKVEENIPENGDFTINGYTSTNLDVAQGSGVEIAVTPKAGYEVESIVGTYVNKSGNVSEVAGIRDGNVYTFPMTAHDVTVQIVYKALPYNVNVTNSNGTQTAPGTYNPQAAGAPGTFTELLDVDNQGYVALLDENGEIFDDGSGMGIYYPANAEYNAGEQVKFAVKAFRGWKPDSVNVTYADGTQSCQTTLKDGVYYFTMPAAEDVAISAAFVKEAYTITKVTAGENHGSILMNGLTENRIQAAYKDGVNVTVTPDEGYYVKSISYALADTTANDFSGGVNYVSEPQTNVHDASHSIDFVVPSSDVTVTVEYAAVGYTIRSIVNGNKCAEKVNTTDGGTVRLSEILSDEGSQIIIKAIPEYGYKLVSLYVKNETTGEIVNNSLKQTEGETGSTYYFEMPADPVVVVADFQKVDYVVTYVNYDNTVIAMEGVTYQAEADVQGHISNVTGGPTGQHFTGWVSEDVEPQVTSPSIANSDFIIEKDTIIKAVFAYDDTDVVFEETENGTVTSEDQNAPFVLEKKYNDDVTFTAVPDEGYEIDTITVSTQDKDNNPVDVQYTGNEDGSYSFTVPATYKPDVHTAKSADVIVRVTFRTKTYTLTKDDACGEEGTIAVNGLVSTQTAFNYQYQEEVNITAVPDAGYYVKSVTAIAEDGEIFTTGKKEAPAIDTLAGDPVTLTFRMPDENVTYSVVYAKIDYSVTTVFNEVQGTVETSPKGKAQIDDIVEVTVTPKKGYALKELTVTYENGEKSVVHTGTGENTFTFTMPAAGVTVTAIFTEVTYTARTEQTGEGKVTLNTYFSEMMNADYLDTVTVGVTPDDGWYLESVTVTGDAQTGNVPVSPAVDAAGGDYTFTMPNCDVTVSVVLKKITYNIETVSDAAKGSVVTVPADSANVDDVVKVNVTPEKGYKLDDLTVTYADGEKSAALTKISDNNYTFTMPAADVTVTAVYTEITYTAALDKEGNGTVRLNGFNTTRIEADYNDTVTVSVTPDEGWELKSVEVAGGDVEVLPEIDPAGGEYTFVMPNYDVEISVVMEKISHDVTTYVVNAYEEGHGTVTMNQTAGRIGDRMVITADPDDGYRVKHVTVLDAEGNSVPVSFVQESEEYVEEWSFTMPASAVDVKVVFEAYAASYYTDSRTDDWYYEAVTFVTDRGFFTGMTDNLFGPNIFMTREMFVTVLARMEGIDPEEWKDVETGFEDVDSDLDGWYAPYVAWAKDAGITTGFNDTEFGVNVPITREQLFTMMYRYAEYKGVDMTVDYPQFMDRYEDTDQISPWAKDALVWCVSEGVAKGMSDTTINPLETAPRAHAAQMFKNYLDNVWYK